MVKSFTIKIFSCVLMYYLFILSTCYSNQLCTGENATLECLMKHSDELQNTDQLWDILNKSSAKAKKCHKAQDVADFLKLIEIPRDGALGEYFSEVVEDLCTKKTDCFFRGLILLTPADQNTIVFELKRPTFQSEASITKAFSRMKGNPKYKRIVDLYMDESKKNSE